MDEDGYPIYRQRDTGTYNRQNAGRTDHKYVDPYNARLFKHINCHTDVEIVSTIRSVKYLYKYIYKGHDANAVIVADAGRNENVIHHDKIRYFLET